MTTTVVCPTCGHPTVTLFVSLRQLALEFHDPALPTPTAATLRARGRRIAQRLGLEIIRAHDGLEFVRAADLHRLAGVAS